MTELTQDLSLAQALSLIDSYAFDLGNSNAEQLLKSWLKKYHASWIRLATIEALYLGRYKAVSIAHILSVWSRIGNPNPHFTYEFERLICRKLPKHLNGLSNLTVEESTASSSQSESSSNSLQAEKAADSNVDGDRDSVDLTKAFKQPQKSERNIPLISALAFPYQTEWSDFAVGQTMIHQFIPVPDVSSFFNKLKTFGEEKLEH